MSQHILTLYTSYITHKQLTVTCYLCPYINLKENPNEQEHHQKKEKLTKRTPKTSLTLPKNSRKEREAVFRTTSYKSERHITKH